jgi:hypothetical protein
MITVRIRERAWIAKLAAKRLGYERVAMVVGQTIYLHNITARQFLANEQWLRHELKHVEQFRRYGLFRFLLLYGWESLKKGYHQNKYEIEARQAEHDEEMAGKYKI